MSKICPVCGIEFYKRRKKKQIYCSHKCSTEAQRKPKSTCEQCGKEFQPKPSKVAPRFCCRSCYEKSREPTKKKCPQCGKVFTSRRTKSIYCSQKCFGDSKRFARKKCLFCGKQLGKDIPVEYNFCDKFCNANYSKAQHPASVCVTCGVTFTAIRIIPSSGRYAPNSRSITCSDACLRKHMTGVNHHAWQGGKAALNTSTHRGYLWDVVAEKARIRDKRTCQHCGITEEELGKKLSVHHIIPYHDINNSKKANRMKNLISLCPSCHHKAEHKIKHQQIILPFAQIAQQDRRAARALIQP